MAAREVGLWLDWCTARDLDPDQARWEHVQAFTGQVPGAAATTARRLGAIRAHYARRRHDLAGAPPAGTATLWPRDAEPELLRDRLWALPAYGFPHAVAGRRDAVIHVLAAEGFDRDQITRVTPAVVALDPLAAINGRDLDMTNHGLRCAKCALTRWLRVLASWWAPDGLHSVERVVENQPDDVRRHDCADPVPDGWQHAPLLVCRIDRGRLLNDRIDPRDVTRAAARTSGDRAGPAMPDASLEGAGEPIPVESPRMMAMRRSTPAERVGPLREISELLDHLDAAIDALGPTDR